MEKKYHLLLDTYNNCLFCCVALTNFHISLHPLHANNGKFEKNYMARLLDQFHRTKIRRREQQNQHLQRKRARLAVEFGNVRALGGP